MPEFKNWTSRVRENAARLVQSEEFQRAYAWARKTSRKIRHNLMEAKKAFQEEMQSGSQDDLKDLKRTLDRLEERDRLGTERAEKTTAPRTAPANPDAAVTSHEPPDTDRTPGGSPDTENPASR